MASKTARLEFRLLPEQKELLEKAATVSGQTITPFAVSILMENARSILEDHRRTLLALRDQELFLKIIDLEEEPSPALKAAVEKFNKENSG